MQPIIRARPLRPVLHLYFGLLLIYALGITAVVCACEVPGLAVAHNHDPILLELIGWTTP